MPFGQNGGNGNADLGVALGYDDKRPSAKASEGTRMEGVRLERVDSRQRAVVRRRARQQQLSNVVPDAFRVVWRVVRTQQLPGQVDTLRCT